MSIEKEVLLNSRTIAVVGLSSKRNRASYRVAQYLRQQGYHIIPVNPGESEVMGEKSWPDLHSVPVPVDVVDIFRRSGAVMPVVQEAVAIGAKVVWMQEGVINEKAADFAREAGLTVIMDRCIARAHRQIFGDDGPQ